MGAGEHLFVREAWNEPCLYLATKMLGPHRDRLHPQLYPTPCPQRGGLRLSARHLGVPAPWNKPRDGTRDGTRELIPAILPFSEQTLLAPAKLCTKCLTEAAAQPGCWGSTRAA